MKNQALFSPKDKSKKLKCLLLQFSFGDLRVKKVDVDFALLSHFLKKKKKKMTSSPLTLLHSECPKLQRHFGILSEKGS